VPLVPDELEVPSVPALPEEPEEVEVPFEPLVPDEPEDPAVPEEPEVEAPPELPEVPFEPPAADTIVEITLPASSTANALVAEPEGTLRRKRSLVKTD